jgi:tRNA G18 (ribose-2'-O)-methylase SpoU
VPLIADPTDPRVADYRAIPEPELLRTRGLFVAEGRLVVRRLLTSPRFRTRSLLVSERTLDSLRDLVDPATAPFDVFVASAAITAAVGGFNFHRGCLALGERRPPQTLDDLALDRSDARLIVVLEGLSQADNVGSVFRNAAAFGVGAVVLDSSCCDPLYRKALRTSMGAALDLPYARLAAASDLEQLRTMGYRLIALTPATDARSIVDAASAMAQARIALLVGAEGAGLSPQMAAMADDRVRIPMAPGVDSLNVATATGIALHRLSGPQTDTDGQGATDNTDSHRQTQTKSARARRGPPF